MKRIDMINSKDIIHHRFELGLTLEQIAGEGGRCGAVAAARSTRLGGASREALPIRWRTKGAPASYP